MTNRKRTGWCLPSGVNLAPIFVRPARTAALLLWASLSLSTAGSQAATWKPDPSLGDPAQHLRLYTIGRNYGDAHFDDKLALLERSPKHPVPHMLRESVYYAYGLLLTEDPADRDRAVRIIRQVLTKQDLRTDSPTYGCLPSYWEDDWTTNVPNTPAAIDQNYTQFVGMVLGEIIDLDRRQGNLLPADLRAQLETSFRLAVLATMRRDVDPGYTNISMLSAAVGAAGDELLHVPGARDFALSKIYWILTRAQPNVTFTEYLSPTYYAVDLMSAYSIRRYAATPEVKAAADRLIDYLWSDIAPSYHAPTYQLAGPHSRSYGIDMLKYTAGLKYFLYLALDGKYPINDTETDHDWDLGGLTVISTLPVEVRPEFKAIPPAWRVVQVGAHFGGPGMLFRQYRDGNFILGSINTQSLWQQQRSVVAYWPSPTPNGPVQFFQDMSALTMGNGYARFASDQSKAAVLAVITGKTPQPAKGGLELGFNLEAKAKPLEGGPPGAYEVDNGGVTTYFYPVTNNGGAFSTRSDTDVTYIERPWSSADVIANYGLLAYLVVFQPPGDAVPTVSNVSLTVAGKVGTAAATVNGAPLSVQVSE